MAEIIEGPATTTDFLGFGIEQLLGGIHFNDRIRIIENIVLAAANNDEMALKWLEFYEYISRKAYHLDTNFMSNTFPHWLRVLYSQLPISRPTFMGTLPVLLKTRDWMLKRIIVGWTPEKNAQSCSIFFFLIDEQKKVLTHFLHSIDTDMHKEARERIPKLIREHTGPEFTPECLEQWIKYYPSMSDDIMQVLAKAWVRNGGWKFLNRYIKGSEYLDVYERAENVRCALGQSFSLLITKIIVTYDDPFSVHFVIHLAGDCTEGANCEKYIEICTNLRTLFEQHSLKTVRVEIMSKDGFKRHDLILFPPK